MGDPRGLRRPGAGQHQGRQPIRSIAARRAKVDADLGDFPWDRVNPHGGTLAIGHPFAATGARILSQATKELAAMPAGSRAIVSVCADGGQGTVALLERV